MTHRSPLWEHIIWWLATLSLVLWGGTIVAYIVVCLTSHPASFSAIQCDSPQLYEWLTLSPLHPIGDLDRTKLAVITQKPDLLVLVPELLNVLSKVVESKTLSAPHFPCRSDKPLAFAQVPDQWPFHI